MASRLFSSGVCTAAAAEETFSLFENRNDRFVNNVEKNKKRKDLLDKKS